jgi:hypothetical protein
MMPAWLTILAEASLALAGLCAVVIAGDILAGRKRWPL